MDEPPQPGYLADPLGPSVDIRSTRFSVFTSRGTCREIVLNSRLDGEYHFRDEAPPTSHPLTHPHDGDEDEEGGEGDEDAEEEITFTSILRDLGSHEVEKTVGRVPIWKPVKRSFGCSMPLEVNTDGITRAEMTEVMNAEDFLRSDKLMDVHDFLDVADQDLVSVDTFVAGTALRSSEAVLMRQISEPLLLGQRRRESLPLCVPPSDDDNNNNNGGGEEPRRGSAWKRGFFRRRRGSAPVLLREETPDEDDDEEEESEAMPMTTPTGRRGSSGGGARGRFRGIRKLLTQQSAPVLMPPPPPLDKTNISSHMDTISEEEGGITAFTGQATATAATAATATASAAAEGEGKAKKKKKKRSRFSLFGRRRSTPKSED